MQYTNDYVSRLKIALRSDAVRRFVRLRLTESLVAINIESRCIEAIHSMLEELAFDKESNGDSLTAAVDKFQRTWRAHLNRAYFNEYEGQRWQYLRDYVLKEVDPDLRLGRCLDIGCGRGCLTAELVTSGVADEAVGIDAADFESEWNERLARSKSSNLDFARVSVAELSEWIERQAKFDTILLLYVLHHSNEYFAALTLKSIHDVLHPDSRLIVLEDSCSIAQPAQFDRDNISDVWSLFAKTSGVYPMTEAFHIQVVLDYVAVQILANFVDVDMPCTFKRSDEWESLFDALGFAVEKTVYLGFPKERDIDVPQSFFVLKRSK